MLNAITAMFVQNELAGGSAAQQRNAAYLMDAAASGDHPRLARLLTQPAAGAARPESAATGGTRPPDRYGDLMSRILAGLLPGQAS